jgi:putative DNA primase/helicase
MMRATDVAARLDLSRYPRSWRGRCPCCDYNGTFSVRAARDDRALLYCANGCKYDDLVKAVASAIGQPVPVRQPGADAAIGSERNRDRALALWRGSEPAVGTLADRYLTARGLAGLAALPALRFRADAPHPEGGRLPAMIALVCDAAGKPLGIHRTFLAKDGSKSRMEPVKASFGPVWSGAIRLDEVADGRPLVIGEGIESSASAARLTGLPAWAAISAGNLASGLVLPPEVRSVVIAADPDKAGVDAARTAWQRLTSERRTVRIAMPDGQGDFNDLLRAREAVNG